MSKVTEIAKIRLPIHLSIIIELWASRYHVQLVQKSGSLILTGFQKSTVNDDRT